MERIPLFPLDAVVYPGEPVPLHVFEERYCLMVEECLATRAPIGVALVAPGQPEDAIEVAPENVGTAVEIVAREVLENGEMHVAAVGTRRFRVHHVVSDRPYQEADVTWLDEPEGDADIVRRFTRDVRDALARVDAADVIEEADDAVEAAYAVAAAMDSPLELKQWILEADTAEERLALEHALLSSLDDAPDAAPA